MIVHRSPILKQPADRHVPVWMRDGWQVSVVALRRNLTEWRGTARHCASGMAGPLQVALWGSQQDGCHLELAVLLMKLEEVEQGCYYPDEQHWRHTGTLALAVL